MTVVRDQLFPQKPPGSCFRFSRTGVQPSPGSSTIELPSAFAESTKTRVVRNCFIIIIIIIIIIIVRPLLMLLENVIKKRLF